MASASPKKVVVLGAGYAGASVAAKFDRMKEIELTLVTPRDFILHKIGSLRAAVKGGAWRERTAIPLDKIVTKGKIVKATATGVDPKAQTVALSDGQTLSYDVLVLATGSRNFSPAEAPKSVTTKEGQFQYFTEMQEAINNAKSVLIVGNGSVGLELSGEIRAFCKPETKITIVSRSKSILDDRGKYRASGIQKILNDLKALKIDLISGDEVTSVPFPEQVHEASPLVPTPDGVTLKSGKKVDCDLLIYSAGSFLNTDFLPSDWLDGRTKEVIVDDQTLQLKAQPNVFAIGDIAKTQGPKRGAFAMQDSATLVKNVLHVVKGGKPTGKVQRMNMILLTLGPKKGRSLLPFTTFGHSTTALLKSKGLFTKYAWHEAGGYDGTQVPKAE